MLLAEQLVGEARARRQRGMDVRERIVDSVSAALFLATAVLIATTMDSGRGIDFPVIVGLVAGYALASRVRFEFADVYVSTEQLVFVPMLVLAPVEYVPLLVVCAALIAVVPELLRGARHQQRWVNAISDSWFCVPPALIVGTLAPGEPVLSDAGVYGLALATQLLADGGWALVRDRLLDPMPLGEFIQKSLGTARVDVVLAPVAFVVAIVAVKEPAVLLVIA